VQELAGAGIPKERITVICPTCTTRKYEDYKKRDPSGSHAVAGAATGGAIGAVLGGLAAVADRCGRCGGDRRRGAPRRWGRSLAARAAARSSAASSARC
jgi:hypothetical protein